MAFKEVRVYFHLPNRKDERSLTGELSSPFSLYMDSIMRGNFKSYSGPEVKGMNLVNLNLYHLETQGSWPSSTCQWSQKLNIYEGNVRFDFSSLKGSEHEKLSHLVNTFVHHARTSTLPQMNTLIDEIGSSKGTIDLDSIFKRAREYREALEKTI